MKRWHAQERNTVRALPHRWLQAGAAEQGRGQSNAGEGSTTMPDERLRTLRFGGQVLARISAALPRLMLLGGSFPGRRARALGDERPPGSVGPMQAGAASDAIDRLKERPHDDAG